MENGVLAVKDLIALTKLEVEDLRFRCQTELFFLADVVLRNKKDPPLVPEVHGTICSQLLNKHPVVPLEQWSNIKERVILSSRGTLKTTIESADIVQSILCYPNVRILILSGKLDLAKSILGLVRGHFESNEVLQFLFPDWCKVSLSSSSEWFTSSARKGVNYREPTISISTFDAVKAGGHFDQLICDDITNEVNNSTSEQTEKTIQQYDDLAPLLEPGGYITFTGTRWAEDDLPEVIRQRGEEYEREYGVKKVTYFCQPAWTLRTCEIATEQIALLEREKAGKLDPKDVILLWPQKLTAKYLWPMYKSNFQKFSCQYLMDPSAAKIGSFTKNLLERSVRAMSDCPLPHKSWSFQNWDLAGVSGKSGVDYSLGISVLWEDTRRMFIFDCVMERFTSSTKKCWAIINFHKKHNPLKCRIEDSNGSRNLEGELLALSKQAGVNLNIEWVPPENKNDAKTRRVMDLVDPMEKGLVQFYERLPHLEEIKRQFLKFTPKSKKLDDGPDCVAQLWQQYNMQIHPAAIERMQPSNRPLIWTVPEVVTDDLENADINWLRTGTVPHASQG